MNYVSKQKSNTDSLFLCKSDKNSGAGTRAVLFMFISSKFVTVNGSAVIPLSVSASNGEPELMPRLVLVYQRITMFPIIRHQVAAYAKASADPECGMPRDI